MNDQTFHPEVIIIYTPGDHQAHLIGAYHDEQGKWLYSPPTYLPEKSLNPFLGELRKAGCIVVDLRQLASMQISGMGQATPILVSYPGVDVRDAAKAAALLHRAILESPDK